MPSVVVVAAPATRAAVVVVTAVVVGRCGGGWGLLGGPTAVDHVGRRWEWRLPRGAVVSG